MYRESIRLKPGITLRSEGDDAKGTDGLKRAEATIIDGGGKEAKQPGILMADGSTLDGFTITNVGVYDEVLWKKHFDSHGEELGDEEGSVQAEGTISAPSGRSGVLLVWILGDVRADRQCGSIHGSQDWIQRDRFGLFGWNWNLDCERCSYIS